MTRASAVFPRLIVERAQQHPERAVLEIGEHRISYGELLDSASRTAGALAQRTVGTGDRVALMLANGPEFLASWLGANFLGAMFVPISTASVGPRLEYVLQLSRPKVLVIDAELAPRLQGLELPAELGTIVVVGQQSADGAISWQDFVAGAEPRMPDPGLHPSQPASIVFTSGTTGPSKGVVCSFGHMTAMADETVEHFGLDPDDVLFDAHPLYHAHAQCQGVMAAVTADCTLVMPDRFSASGFIPTIRERRVTVAFLVGAAGLVLKQPPSPADREHSLRLLCAIPVPPGRHLEMEERFGVPVIDEYGSTEMGVATLSPLENRVPGSCGKATSRREMIIVDDDGWPAPPGVKGEILARSTQPDAFYLEYFDMPQETLQSNRDFWFHSGDYGSMDAEGNIFFLGRKKDSIRRLGENVSAVDVEQIIDRHPGVARSAVIGVPSELGEEEIWAVIELLDPAAPVTAEELWQYCSERMERYAVPRYIEFAETLPLTSTGRVEKYRLRDRGMSNAVFDAQLKSAAERSR